MAPLYVQWAPLELWWMTSLKVRGSFIYGWHVGGSMGVGLSNFGARSSSLILVGFLLIGRDSTRRTSGSSLFVTEGLLSRCDILGDSTLAKTGESASALAVEPLRHLGQWALFLLQTRAPVKLQWGTRSAS